MQKERYMRDYTVTKKPYQNGDVFIHEGVKYQRKHIGGAIFDLRMAGKPELDEYIADSKLTAKQFYAKYPK
jgi:hypothetical protein